MATTDATIPPSIPQTPLPADTQPRSSILLNCPFVRRPTTPPKVINGHSTEHALEDSDASPSAGPSRGRPKRSSSVHFAPLPEVPAELKRRSSITLGVAARKHLLASQGAPKAQQGVVLMNEQEWESYKASFTERTGPDPVDLGEVLTSVSKSLWRKVRPAPSTSASPSPKLSLSPALSPRRFRRPLGSSDSTKPDLQSVTEATTHEEVAGLPAASVSDSPTRSTSHMEWTPKPRGSGDCIPRHESPPPAQPGIAEDDEDSPDSPQSEMSRAATISIEKVSASVGDLALGRDERSAGASRARSAAVLGFDDSRFK